jgi:hypothetical protein
MFDNVRQEPEFQKITQRTGKEIPRRTRKNQKTAYSQRIGTGIEQAIRNRSTADDGFYVLQQIRTFVDEKNVSLVNPSYLQILSGFKANRPFSSDIYRDKI